MASTRILTDLPQEILLHILKAYFADIKIKVRYDLVETDHSSKPTRTKKYLPILLVNKAVHEIALQMFFERATFYHETWSFIPYLSDQETRSKRDLAIRQVKAPVERMRHVIGDASFALHLHKSWMFYGEPLKLARLKHFTLVSPLAGAAWSSKYALLVPDRANVLPSPNNAAHVQRSPR